MTRVIWPSLSTAKVGDISWTLAEQGTFHSHVGVLAHRDIIGQEQGGWFRTSRGHTLLAIKPTLADYVLEMPRSAQIVYPKDLGNILVMADIFPGATVVEAGLGSGALTAALLRAVGERGSVITYEVRQDMVDQGMKNVRTLAPDPCNHTLRMESIYEGINEREGRPDSAGCARAMAYCTLGS